MRRTGWRQTPDLSPKMEWKHANEPTVMTWTVKAIDRSVAFWTVFFLPMFIIPLIAFIATLFAGFSLLSWGAIFCFSFVLFLYIKVGLERTVFVYRATDEHLEICQWQDIPDMVFTFLRVFPFVIVGIILMLFITDPGLSIAALVGPALLGFLMASFGADPNYKAMHKKFRQHDYRWDNVDRAMLDLDKNLLALSVSGPNDVIQDHEIDFNNPDDHRYLMPVFFRKDQEEAVLNLFKNKMPSKATTVSGNYKYLFCG